MPAHSIESRVQNRICNLSRDAICFSVLVALSIALHGCDKSPTKSSENTTTSKSTENSSKKKDHSIFQKTSNKTPSKPQNQVNQAAQKQTSNTNPKKQQPKKPQPKIVLSPQRPSDNRPVHNDQRLEKLGIRKYESKRLKLYTDIEPKVAQTLPKIIDQAYAAWVEYFGELPPNPEKSEFQITGYLMKNRDLFQNAGLIPKTLRRFRSGRHLGLQFWMHDQTADFYRKHLLIHEATHCFMYQMRGHNFRSWYMEGMAEFFGVHSVDAAGDYRFGVMPADEEHFRGFGRIQIVRKDFQQGKWIAFENVRTMNIDDYISTTGYAWSWAICQFLDTHPKYRKDFRALRKIHDTAEFEKEFHRRFLARQKNLGTEWLLFAIGLQEGFDIKSSAIEFRDGVPLALEITKSEIRIEANKNWQSSGIEVEEGKTYKIVASGSFSLGKKPKPWTSEPQGISIVYFDGKPLGRLLGAIHTSDSARVIAEGKLPQMSKTISVGRGITFQAPATGTFYFRINDSWSDLADNEGTVKVSVKRITP